MAVIFDVYLFTQEYVDKVKEDERSKKHARRQPDGQVDYEIGSVACRNVQRTQPIFFYDLDELFGLFAAGFAIGSEVQIEGERIATSDFPADSVTKVLVEVDKDDPLTGRFTGPDGQASEFGSREDLELQLAPYIHEN